MRPVRPGARPVGSGKQVADSGSVLVCTGSVQELVLRLVGAGCTCSKSGS